jgi:hypothetical protein
MKKVAVHLSHRTVVLSTNFQSFNFQLICNVHGKVNDEGTPKDWLKVPFAVTRKSVNIIAIGSEAGSIWFHVVLFKRDLQL